MDPILIAILVLGGMGLLFGLVLAIASRVFYVKTDPRLDQLIEALPGANCGGCGFSGCAAYAQAVLEGKAPVGKCASGGDAAAEKMAEIMGVKAEKVARKVALVRCSGTQAGNAKKHGGGHLCPGPAVVNQWQAELERSQRYVRLHATQFTLLQWEFSLIETFRFFHCSCRLHIHFAHKLPSSVCLTICEISVFHFLVSLYALLCKM